MPVRSQLPRRLLFKAAAASAFAAPLIGEAQAADPLYFATWSAAVDQVQAHLAAFQKETGIPVTYTNSPYAQYRETMITKFTGGAPVDMLWVSDAWLPEFAEAEWLVPIDGFANLMQYVPQTSDFCTAATVYKGKHYGLTYYTDTMAFLYDEEILAKAGFAAPPATWEEVTAQALAIKAKGLAEYPVMIGMAQESWQIEFMTAVLYSHGGRFVDDAGHAVMQDPKAGALAALTWLVDAVQTHKILSPGAVQTGELEVLKSASAGRHAFVLLPKFRLAVLNDPAQSQVAGKFKQALMPSGPAGSHATVGWMRFYGITPHAVATAERGIEVARLMEWFGGKADGEFRFEKILLKQLALSFGIKSLYQDPEIRAVLGSYGDVNLMEQQQALAQKKDTIAPWFGEWNDTNGTAWQQALLRQVTPEQALQTSAAKWDALKKLG
jgi:multiple sugar transport system substrate-binding protein